MINITQSSPQPRTAAGHRSYQQFYLCSSPRGIENAAAESIGSTESTGKWPISISQGEILQHGSAKAASTVKKSLGTIPDSTTKVLFKHPLWGWREAATSASDLKIKLFEKHLRSVCLLSPWFYPDTSNVKTHLLALFAFHLILDKHSSTSPDKGM